MFNSTILLCSELWRKQILEDSLGKVNYISREINIRCLLCGSKGSHNNFKRNLCEGRVTGNLEAILCQVNK